LDMKRLVSSRQSLPLILGTLALALITYVLMRAGNQAVDDVSQQSSGKSGAPADRELVTIHVGARWKLKKASWGSVQPPEKPLPLPEEEHDPKTDAYQGLDIAVVGK